MSNTVKTLAVAAAVATAAVSMTTTVSAGSDATALHWLVKTVVKRAQAQHVPGLQLLITKVTHGYLLLKAHVQQWNYLLPQMVQRAQALRQRLNATYLHNLLTVGVKPMPTAHPRGISNGELYPPQHPAPQGRCWI